MNTRDTPTRSQKRELAKQREMLDGVLQNPHARRLLRMILDETGLYKEAFTGNSQTFYYEGRRSIGLWLIGVLSQHNPKAFLQLQMEAVNEAVALEAQREHDQEEDDHGDD